jgi:hypothetical protein
MPHLFHAFQIYSHHLSDHQLDNEKLLVIAASHGTFIEDVNESLNQSTIDSFRFVQSRL